MRITRFPNCCGADIFSELSTQDRRGRLKIVEEVRDNPARFVRRFQRPFTVVIAANYQRREIAALKKVGFKVKQRFINHGAPLQLLTYVDGTYEEKLDGGGGGARGGKA